MSRAAIDGLLTDFGPDPRSAALSQGVTDALVGLFQRASGPAYSHDTDTPTAEPELDLEMVKEEAREEGRQEARAQAEADLEERLALERSSFDEQVAQMRKQWALEAGVEIADQIAGGFQSLSQDLSSAVTRVLTPFLTEEVKRHAAESLAQQVLTLASDERGVRFEISGPDDLLEIVRSRLEPTLTDVGWHSAQQTEVRAVANATMIETQLTAWLRWIEEYRR